MADRYVEVIDGESFVRAAPGERHEQVLRRLRQHLLQWWPEHSPARLLEARDSIQVDGTSRLCPDLAVVTVAQRKLLLAVEVIAGGDHHLDTVAKKECYERARIPRLWMVDTRYDNVEAYECSPHGLRLRGMLAGNEPLTEQLLPGFEMVVRELFAGE